MTPQEAENGRRRIARECYNELEANRPLNDDKRRTILQSYLEKFTKMLTEYHFKRSVPALWLNVYVRMIEKEKKYG